MKTIQILLNTFFFVAILGLGYATLENQKRQTNLIVSQIEMVKIANKNTIRQNSINDIQVRFNKAVGELVVEAFLPQNGKLKPKPKKEFLKVF